MEQEKSSYLERLISKRSNLHKEREGVKAKRQGLIDVAQDTGKDKFDEVEDREFREFTDEIKRLDGEIAEFDKRISDLDEENQRAQQLRSGAAIADRAKSGLEFIAEKATYQKGDPRRSYLKDLVMTSIPGRDTSGEAMDRLQRHAKDVETLPEYRDLNSTDGTGGYAIPPAWLMDQYIALARAGRPTANIVTNEALPGGTNSINIPKLATGTSTAIQNGDNTAVVDVDLTDTSVQANVKTVAGQQGLSLQLLDQSPIAFDQVVFRDLLADHASKVDQQVLYGTNSNGQVQGINGTSGIITVATGGVTVPYTWAAIANAAQQINSARFLPATHIVMHPRRWGWLQSLLDTTNRPIFTSEAQHPMNAAGLVGSTGSQKVVGNIQGLDVVTDPNILTTSGGTNNQDNIYVMKADDLILWESGVRTRVLPETKAANLTVLLQVYSYLAFTAARFPQSVAVITGFTSPTWGS